MANPNIVNVTSIYGNVGYWEMQDLAAAYQDPKGYVGPICG